MKAKKSLLAAAAVATIGMSTLVGVSTVSAQSGDMGSDSLIDKLAQRFNLDKAQVQEVFEEEKAERETERQQAMSDRLQEAVDNGELTAEQKTLIENKWKELQADREAEHNKLQAWAEEHGINTKFVMLMPHPSKGDSYLQRAVDKGNLTVEQKTLIEEKQADLREARQADREALKQWAEEHDIDTKYLMPVVKMQHDAGPAMSRF